MFQNRGRGASNPLADRQQGGCSSQNRARGQREYGNQSGSHAAGITRVGHLAQPLQQAQDVLGHDRWILAELVKGRRDR
ncbi:hypothetical protein [Streptomyces sp. M1013]|uniref:hypothetical protein n=1 Tax=Streptomyces sp. M1013 TaxID=549798 RepID=UPI00209ACCD4|nr:hypothetical protein [Streptomyces sp. M1013]